MVSRTLLLLWLLLAIAICASAAKLQDPMRPLGYQVPTAKEQAAGIEKKQQGWRLGAVLIGSDRNVALINGHSLQVGDNLDGFKLVEIKPDSVTLQRKDKKVVLRRAGSGLKKAFLSRDVRKGSQP